MNEVQQMERPKGEGDSEVYVQCRGDPPWWIGAIGTVEIPSLVHQLGGGGSACPNMKRPQNTTAT